MFLLHTFLNYTKYFHFKEKKKKPVTYQKPAAGLISALGTDLAPAHITLCLRIMLMNAKTGQSTCPPLLLNGTITKSPGFTVRTAVIFSVLHATKTTLAILNDRVCLLEYSCNGFIVKVTPGTIFPLRLGGVEGDAVWRHHNIAICVVINV